MITLRQYQLDDVQRIRAAFAAGFKAPLYVAPTGSGKTKIFSYIAESSQRRGKRVLVLCHRVELVDQIIAALKECNVKPDVIAAGYNRSAGRAMRATNLAVAVASVQTLVRRLDSYPAPTLIIGDEAHHFAGGNSWSQIAMRYPDAKLLGVTATPIRLDGRGMAAHFDHLIVGPSVAALTAMGFLAPARIFAPPTVDTSGLHIRAGDYKPEESEALMDVPSITGDAICHYRKHAEGKGAIVFCTSVAHAHHVAEKFRSGGIAAVALDGATDRQVRRMAVADFKSGAIKVLTNCGIFSEGFDCEGIHAGILLRPTASEALWRQQIGRVLRPAVGKSHAIILDHVNMTQRFGLPSDDRQWALTEDTEKRKKKPAPAIRVCVKCFAASPARAAVCVECGHVFEVKPRAEVEEREGELVELTAEEIQRKRERKQQGMSTLQQLRDIERIKRYKPGWADHVYAARMKKKLRRMSA